MEHAIGLTDFITALRTELQQCAITSSDEPLRFLVDDVELELEVAITRGNDQKGTGHIKFWVFEFGGERKGMHEIERTQKLMLKLKPLWRNDERVKVLIADATDRDPNG